MLENKHKFLQTLTNTPSNYKVFTITGKYW